MTLIGLLVFVCLGRYLYTIILSLFNVKLVIFFSHVYIICAISAQKQDVRLTKEQESRLPSHWLKSKGAHKTMADALWRLRDLMLRDTLNIRQMHNL